MDTLLTMSVELFDNLISYELAIKQIRTLHVYIELLSSGQACRFANESNMKFRISVAEGVKRMYDEYRRQKWVEIEATLFSMNLVAELSGMTEAMGQPVVLAANAEVTVASDVDPTIEELIGDFSMSCRDN